jgi:uncharacterized protein (DUF4415 family)
MVQVPVHTSHDHVFHIYWDTLMTQKPTKTRGRPKAEKTMHQIAVRLDEDLIKDIDKTIERVSEGLFKVERSAVLREALATGWPAVKKKLEAARK